MSEVIKSHLKRVSFHAANLQNDKFLAALEGLTNALFESDFDSNIENGLEVGQRDDEHVEEEKEEGEVRTIP